MRFIAAELPGVVIIEPSIYEDDRGWFMESFNQQQFEAGLNNLGLSLEKSFVQDNHSCSSKGVLRGLHYQAQPFAQGKLVRVVRGSAYDVVVDIRKESPTCMHWLGVNLDTISHRMLWIPEGFAHGFVALEDDTHFLYKTTDYYNKASERTILWNDPKLAITWPDTGGYKVSEKDANASVFDVFSDF